jgi:hypothetical protein
MASACTPIYGSRFAFLNSSLTPMDPGGEEADGDLQVKVRRIWVTCEESDTSSAYGSLEAGLLGYEYN